MAWFGEIKNLTGNLTGQLSNVANTAASFTRDVLAEGAEEVSDQGTELKMAQDKIRELEGLVVAQRSENERLKDLNHELADKAEASELQINTISHQYRSVLQEKHDELSALKQQQHALQDMQHSMLAASRTAAPPSASITHSTSTSSLSGSLVSSDEHDFGDLISSQHEINRLSNEVSRLRSECDHWKQMASVTSQGDRTGTMFEIGLDKEGASSSNAEEVLQLKTKIKELEHNLSHEIDESQRELSALQDAHSQKLATLGRRHKQEIEDYTQRIEQLEQVLQSGETPPTSPPITPVHTPATSPSKKAGDLQNKVKELQEALKKSQRSFGHLDDSCKRLRVELEQVKQVEKEKSRTAVILRKQVEAVKAEKEKGMQENETLRWIKRDLAGKLDAERQENARLLEECDKARGQTDDGREEMERVRKGEVAPLQDKLSKMEKELEDLRTERDQASTSATRQELHEARKKFSTGAMQRRTQLLKEKQVLVNQMIGVGEQVSEGKTSVAVLKAASDQMGNEAEDIITDMGDGQGKGEDEDEDITPDLLHALEEENQHLRQKVGTLETEVRQLNVSCASLTEDKESCESLILQLNRDMEAMRRSKLDASSSHSGSHKTLECSGDSETESNARLQLAEADDNGKDDVRRIQYKRPSSPSGTSTDSERTTSSGRARMQGYATSESEVPDSQASVLESSDNISFDGEYDDSIIFSGMKQRFPEAAHVFQEQIEHFELIRADWDMEKQALEEVVIRMREQLKEKDIELQSLTAQKGLREIETQQMDQLEEDLETLQDTVEKMEEEHDQAEQEKKAIIQEKEAFQQELESLQKEHRTQKEASQVLSKEVESLKSKLHQAEGLAEDFSQQAEGQKKELNLQKEASLQEIEALKSKLHQAQDAAEHSARQTEERQEALHLQKEASLKDDGDRDRLEADLLLLNQQHQQALDQLIQSRDKIKVKAETLEVEKAELLSNLSNREAGLTEHEALRTRYDEEVKELRDELDRRKAELSDLSMQKGEHEEEILNFGDELEDAKTIKKELEDTNMELVLQANESKVNLEYLEKELLQLKKRQEKMVSLEVNEQLNSSIAELEGQLQQATTSSEESKSTVKELESRICELEASVKNLADSEKTLDMAVAESKEKLEVQLASSEQTAQLLANGEDEIDKLKRDKESLLQELQQNKQQHEKTLRELSQSRELDTSTLQTEHEKLIQLKNAKETKVMKLKSEYEELQADLSETKDMLNTTLEGHQQLAEILKTKDEDIKNLAEENSYFFKAVEESKNKGKQFEEMREKLQETEVQLEDTKAKNVILSREVQRLQLDLKDQLERSDVETKTLEVITELEGEVRDHREMLERKEEEALTLQGVIKEKQAALVQLEEKVGQQAREFGESQSEISQLKSQVTSLKQELDETAQMLKCVNEDVQKSQEKLAHDQAKRESALDSQSAWIIERDNQILELSETLSSIKDQIKNQAVGHAKEVNEKNTELSLLKDKLEKLRRELDFRQRSIGEIKAEHTAVLGQKDAQHTQLTERLEQLTREANAQKSVAPLEDRENGIIEEEVLVTKVPDLHSAKTEPLQAKRVNQMSETITESSLSDNEKHLENAVQEKEKEITLLKESNRSLTSLLEDKSCTAMGNTILVDLHKLQMKVRTYDSERSQMMTVLNEKTRECSNLKNEVHRLVKVVSAQRTALDKAQEDNREIQRHMDEPQNDMQKQALQNLSRLIQDKDLEIEALKQKNDSLLQVLHASEPNSSSDISRVLGDSEQLQKENKMLKEERDQLVVSIHQKHHESLTYYEEVQRLVGVVNKETHQQAELQQRYNSVYADLDDKERSLSQLVLDIEQRDSSFANLHKQLEEKNQSVLELESQLSDLNESMAKQHKELQESLSISQSQQEHEHLSALLRTKEEEISGLKSQIQAQVERVQIADISVASEGLKSEVAPVQTAPPPNEEALERKEAKISQLREQLDHQTKALSDKDSAIKTKQDELQHRLGELAGLRQEVDLLNQALLQRDAALQLRNKQLQTLTNDSKSRDVELHGLQSQNQTLSVQLQGFQSENQNLKKENQALQHSVHNKDGEGRSLQDMCNRLAAQIREKEFEIGALKEKNQTLTSLVQQREEGTSGELQRLLGETEAMQKQAQMFQQERDQALLALQRHQADLQALQSEVHNSRDREQRLVGELDRLRDHLLQVEEGYTREALQGEEREKELRNRLAQAEEAARTRSSAVHSASKEASSQIESLLDQLHSVTSQKDQVLLQLGEAQEQVQQYSTSLANLQMVLEQFTQEKEAAIAADVERYKVRADEKSKIAEQLFKQTVELQERLAATTEALEAASRLSEQLDRKEEVAGQLREELAKKEELLHEYEARFDEIGNASDSKVDKPLMKNLLLGYFSAPQKKRPEVLKLLGGVLNFNSEDLQKIGAEGSQGGWLSGLWGRGTPTSTPPSTPLKTALENSFSEQFVKFLEHESSPVPKVRLPLEEMTQEKPRSPRGQAFNPFSAPVPQYSPFIQHHPESPRGSGEPHQFVKPMLAPKSVLPAVPTIAPVFVPNLSGRSSPGSKGASAGLKDILQQ